MSAPYHTLVLAPHLDDAALSCGGQLADLSAAGEQVLVYTLMAGDPPAMGHTDSPLVAELHARWALDADVVAARRSEDAAACRLLGVDWLHGPLPDCIYRGAPGGGELYYQTNDALFGPPHPDEVERLVPHIVALLAALPPAGRILAPLTVGGHVDHRLTRLAAERHYGAALHFYEDYPYAREPGALEAVLPAPRHGWTADVIPVSPRGLQRKLDAVLAYESQLSTFFGDVDDVRDQITRFTARTGGERCWHRLPAAAGPG